MILSLTNVVFIHMILSLTNVVFIHMILSLANVVFIHMQCSYFWGCFNFFFFMLIFVHGVKRRVDYENIRYVTLELGHVIKLKIYCCMLLFELS